jgi:hypothetical protein
MVEELFPCIVVVVVVVPTIVTTILSTKVEAQQSIYN